MFHASDPERLAVIKSLKPGQIGSRDALDSGIHGLFITCIAQKVKESPEAFETFFNLTSLKDIEYKLATDFKVHNICSGLNGNNAACPCPYCDQLRKYFHKKGKARTIRSNKRKFDEFQLDNGITPRNFPGKFDSVCREPIMPGFDDDELILHCIPPSELHLMEGITNHVLTKIRFEIPELFKGFMQTLGLDREKYEMYTKKCNYDGNDVKKILNHINDFIVFCEPIQWPFGDVSALPHLHFLRAFSKVVHSCFGFLLEPDYAEKIALAKEAFDLLCSATAKRVKKKLRVHYFYKVHVLIFHVGDFVEKFGPLGPFSEQAGETVHSWWTKLWISYRSLPLTPGERLLRALVEWNFRRLSLILENLNDDD